MSFRKLQRLSALWCVLLLTTPLVAQERLESGDTVTLAFDDSGSPVDPAESGVYNFRTTANGSLLVEASAPTGDPALMVVGRQEGTTHRDENSGGGTTAFLALGVEAGVDYDIHLIGRPEGGACEATLRVREVPEPDALLELFDRTRQRLLDLNNVELGPAEVNAVYDNAWADLKALEEPSMLAIDLLTDFGDFVDSNGYLKMSFAALLKADQMRAELLPRTHPEIWRAKRKLVPYAVQAGDTATAVGYLVELTDWHETGVGDEALSVVEADFNSLTRYLRGFPRFAEARRVAKRWEDVVSSRPLSTPGRQAALDKVRFTRATLAQDAGDPWGAAVIWKRLVDDLEARGERTAAAALVARWNWSMCVAATGDYEGALDISAPVLPAVRENRPPGDRYVKKVERLRESWRAAIESAGAR